MQKLLCRVAIVWIAMAAGGSVACAQMSGSEDLQISDLVGYRSGGLEKLLPKSICIEGDAEDRAKLSGTQAEDALAVGSALVGRYACDVAAVRLGWKGWILSNRMEKGYLKHSDLVEKFAERGLSKPKANILAKKTLNFNKTRLPGGASLVLLTLGLADAIFSLDKPQPSLFVDLAKECGEGSATCLAIQALALDAKGPLIAPSDPALPITSKIIPECALQHEKANCKAYEELLTSGQ